MYVGARGPAEPEARDDEERTGDAGERETPHFFVARPRFVGALSAQKNGVPRKIHECGDEGADADGQEGQAGQAGVEGVDAGKDDWIGL